MKKLLTTTLQAILIGVILTLSGCATEEASVPQDLSIPQSTSGIETPANSAF